MKQETIDRLNEITDELLGKEENSSESELSDLLCDLQIDDCIYANGFPANIEYGLPFVVQIPERDQGVVLYTCKITGKQTRCYLPTELNIKYTNDMYVFGT